MTQPNQTKSTKENNMSKLENLKSAIMLLEGQDIDALKQALALVGEPVAQTQQATTDFFEIGKAYFIRTVTLYQVGRMAALTQATGGGEAGE